jgi:hypothetical protein
MKPRYITLTILLALCQYAILKWKFPLPAMTGDSDSYLMGAYYKMGANTWPIGYSMFLRLVGVFSRSANAVVFVQYYIYIICAFYFFSTLKKRIELPKIGWVLLYLLLFLNPIVVLLNNLIMSDAIFLSLSLVWFIEVIKISDQKKGWLFIITHPILLLTIFTFRHQSAIYPIISAFVFVAYAKNKLIEKLLFNVAIFIVFGLFITYTIFQNEKYTAVRQFSAFPGWQTANNALIGFSQVSKERRSETQLPTNLSSLNKYVNKYIDSVQDHPGMYDSMLSTSYMWRDFSPLRRYAIDNLETVNNAHFGNYTMMAKFSDLYGEFGNALIKKYPTEYFKYYLFRNLTNNFLPPTEVLMQYRANSITDIEKKWFSDTDWSKDHYDDFFISELENINIINIPIFLFYLISIGLYYFERKESNKFLQSYVRLSWMFFLVNLLFLSFTTPIVLRYILLNQIIELVFIVILFVNVFYPKNPKYPE